MCKLIICSILVFSATLVAHEPREQGRIPLTIVVDYEQSRSAVSFAAMQTELQSIMDSVGVQVDLLDKSHIAPNAAFGDLLIFKMRGSCDATSWPVGALSDERGPLAMAYSTDGQILPFGEVECDLVRESLSRILGERIRSPHYGSLYGSALAMVMAHEIYHMLGHESRHTRTGVTKEKLSARELLEGDLSLPEIAREAIKRNGQH